VVVGLTTNTFAIQNPVMSVDVIHNGLYLWDVATLLNADANGLNFSTQMTWAINQLNATIELIAIGNGGVSFANPTNMTVELNGFGNSGYYPNGFRWFYVSPVLSSSTYSLLTYKLNFTNFAEEFNGILTPHQTMVSGQVSLSFFTLGIIQEEADTKFMKISLSCDCSGSSAYLSVATSEPYAQHMIAQIGNTNLEMGAPNWFRTNYVVMGKQDTSLYSEWEVVAPPPWYVTQPYDWVISGIVGAIISGGLGFGVGRWKNRKKVMNLSDFKSVCGETISINLALLLIWS
jgi:hypothetical protein